MCVNPCNHHGAAGCLQQEQQKAEMPFPLRHLFGPVLRRAPFPSCRFLLLFLCQQRLGDSVNIIE